MNYELTINYPPTSEGEWWDADTDDQIIDAVGSDPSGSGSGPLTGGRDLHFDFDSRLDAEHALRRVKEILGDAEYKWSIVLWNDDGSSRTLDMGQSKQETANEAQDQA